MHSIWTALCTAAAGMAAARHRSRAREARGVPHVAPKPAARTHAASAYQPARDSSPDTMSTTSVAMACTSYDSASITDGIASYDPSPSPDWNGGGGSSDGAGASGDW